MPLKDRLKMRHLRTLVAIAEHGSMVRAAKALSISQPAVTKTLAELEDIAGHRLCERSPKGVTLTGAGQILVRHTGSGLRAIHDGLSSLSADEEGDGGRGIRHHAAQSRGEQGGEGQHGPAAGHGIHHRGEEAGGEDDPFGGVGHVPEMAQSGERAKF